MNDAILSQLRSIHDAANQAILLITLTSIMLILFAGGAAFARRQIGQKLSALLADTSDWHAYGEVKFRRLENGKIEACSTYGLQTFRPLFFKAFLARRERRVGRVLDNSKLEAMIGR
jgi:hypothetical protein